MAQFSGIRCDGCEVVKKQSNHWALAEVLDDSTGKHLFFWAWNDELATAPGILHLCGAGCANKVLSRVFHAWQDVPAMAEITADPKDQARPG